MAAVEGSVPHVYVGSVFRFVPANHRVKNSGFARHGSTFGLMLNACWQIELEAFKWERWRSWAGHWGVRHVFARRWIPGQKLPHQNLSFVVQPHHLSSLSPGFFGLMTLLMETSTVLVRITGQHDLQGQDLLWDPGFEQFVLLLSSSLCSL